MVLIIQRKRFNDCTHPELERDPSGDGSVVCVGCHGVWETYMLYAAMRAVGDLKAALMDIRNNQGRVCEEFELCKHASCASSVAAWFIADRVLNPETYKNDVPSKTGDSVT